jgi:transposase
MDHGEMKVMWESMSPSLNEKQRRLYAATLVKVYGFGGSKAVSEMTGLSLNTLTVGKKELGASGEKAAERIRRPGAGPKLVEFHHPDIREKIREIVDESAYGSPEKVLSWTTESLRKISEKLATKYNIMISHVTVGAILTKIGYNKQENKKMIQVGEPHPDRNAQFEYINTIAKNFIDEGNPVISVDTKKKELIGNFRNNGQEYRRKSDPRKVLDHDFPIKELVNLRHTVFII